MMRLLAYLCGAVLGPWLIVAGIVAAVTIAYLPLLVLGVLLTGAAWAWLDENT